MFTRFLKAGVVASLVAIGLVGGGSASAIDQDLVVSAASGAPGDQVTVSSASCAKEDVDSFGYVEAALLVGTAPNQVLAGYASDFPTIDGESFDSAMVIPDWVDPTEPAVIKAQCVLETVTGDEFEVTTEPFDDVAFDVLAGGGPGVQAVTLSRTSLMAGQAFTASATGCTLPDPTFAGSDLLDNSDLSGWPLGNGVTYGESATVGADFEVPVIVSNASIGFLVGIGSGGDIVDVEVEEEPLDIPAGDYLSVTYCGDDDAMLIFEPSLMEITGSAPTGDVDLVVADNTDEITLQGVSCTSGDVLLSIATRDVDDIGFEDGVGEGGEVVEAGASPLDGDALKARLAPRTPSDDGFRQVAPDPAALRALIDDGFVDATATPDADGTWAYADKAGLEQGLVLADSACGDPFEDGFFYDPQGAAINVEPPPMAPVTTTTTVPPAPAYAVEGTPTYAG